LQALEESNTLWKATAGVGCGGLCPFWTEKP
jgi:hypothetical protein